MQEGFQTLVQMVRVEIWIVVAAYAFVLIAKATTGELRLSGLISDKRTGAVSPARVQALMLTFAAVGAVAGGMAPTGSGGAASFLDSGLAPTLLGGGQMFYLFAKSRFHP